MPRNLAEVGLSIKRLQQRHHRALDDALTPHGLTLVQWDALRHLHTHPEASLHELAQLTFQTDQSMGALATRMVDRGLIERVGAPGRAVRHRLTERGEQVREEGQRVVEAVIARSLAPLTAEQLEAFDDLLLALGPE